MSVAGDESTLLYEPSQKVEKVGSMEVEEVASSAGHTSLTAPFSIVEATPMEKVFDDVFDEIKRTLNANRRFVFQVLLWFKITCYWFV